MGLLQKAYETYEYHKNLVGVISVNQTPLSPCSHMTAKAELDITIDQNGHFIQAEAVSKDAPKIIIPVTEHSAGRSGKNPLPHPLCDQLAYLAPYNENKHRLYVDQLRDWVNSPFSHPKLAPILAYVEGETIVSDLLRAGVIKLKDGKPEKEKSLVRWQVVGLEGNQSGPCWKDLSLFQSFEAYYQNQKSQEETVLCMVTGQTAAPAVQHLKGIVAAHGNAKLISSNDSTDFTYRGRFTSVPEAETVSYEASQKAHNALRWLIANQGVSSGDRFFVCWEPQQLRLPALTSPLLPILPSGQELPPAMTPSDYHGQLTNTLNGWKSSLPAESATAIIAAFDAATSGRLSVTYYNELKASDFLDRLYDWDNICCWINGNFGIQSPSIYDLVKFAYGTQREEKGIKKMDVDEKFLRQQIQCLIACRINQSNLPLDLVHNLVSHASNLQIYEKKKAFDLRDKLLFTACAAIRKYRYDRYNKEEWEMALQPDKKDRSYQYGRLLAVLEKAERDTFSEDEKREPNAMRLQSVFYQRPQYAAQMIFKQVKTAYYPRLPVASRTYYNKLIDDIMDVLSEFPDSELNRPLGETYLMGYSLQQKALYTKKENGGNNNESSAE